MFAHWRVPFAKLRALIPEPLQIDTFDGEAWIGVVPFELRIRPRWMPVIPKIASFPEINVRTYVTLNGQAGVWFFSLDAASPLAVRAARWSFNLPYFDAKMVCRETNDGFDYESQRRKSKIPADFRARYEATSDPFEADSGSLEEWLTERYCLYAQNRLGSILQTEVHHAKWQLQNAKCQIQCNSMTAPLDIVLTGDPLLHFARSIDVVNWLPKKVAG